VYRDRTGAGPGLAIGPAEMPVLCRFNRGHRGPSRAKPQWPESIPAPPRPASYHRW